MISKIKIEIRIMDAFVAMRRFMVTNAEVFQRLSTMECHQLEMQQHQQETDKRIDEVFRRLDEGNLSFLPQNVICCFLYIIGGAFHLCLMRDSYI